jgi:hypothetical protein
MQMQFVWVPYVLELEICDQRFERVRHGLGAIRVDYENGAGHFVLGHNEKGKCCVCKSPIELLSSVVDICTACLCVCTYLSTYL